MWALAVLWALFMFMATLSGMLGSTHFHRQAQTLTQTLQATPQEPPHHHGFLGHHVHDVADASVVMVGADDDAQRDLKPSSGAAWAGSSARVMAVLPCADRHATAAWGPADGPAVKSCDARRLERPPKA